jgi:hypothetical protein
VGRGRFEVGGGGEKREKERTLGGQTGRHAAEGSGQARAGEGGKERPQRGPQWKEGKGRGTALSPAITRSAVPMCQCWQTADPGLAVISSARKSTRTQYTYTHAA